VKETVRRLILACEVLVWLFCGGTGIIAIGTALVDERSDRVFFAGFGFALLVLAAAIVFGFYWLAGPALREKGLFPEPIYSRLRNWYSNLEN
jgi:hypothetical protein